MNRRAFVKLFSLACASAAIPAQVFGASMDPALAAAIDAGATFSEVSDGYCITPTGVVYQWGFANGTDVTFPIAMGTCLNVMAVHGTDEPVLIEKLGPLGCRISQPGCAWLAIGARHE